jgi:hypothetical protein
MAKPELKKCGLYISHFTCNGSFQEKINISMNLFFSSEKRDISRSCPATVALIWYNSRTTPGMLVSGTLMLRIRIIEFTQKWEAGS